MFTNINANRSKVNKLYSLVMDMGIITIMDTSNNNFNNIFICNINGFNT